MSAQPFILFPGAAKWRVGSTDIDTDADAHVEQIAATVAAALKTAGYNGQGALLAIPSQWCLCAPIKTSGLPARNRRQAMTYRLEENLPLAAEDVIADFVPFDPGDTETFGVCVEKQKLSPLVEALESAGVVVAAICPAALLAVQEMLPALGAVDSILLPSSDRDALDLFILKNGRVRAWYLLGNNPRELHRQLAVEFHRKQTASTLAAGEIKSDMRDALAPVRLIDAPVHDPISAATSLAVFILSGKTAAWIDLRRDSLAAVDPLRQIRTPLNFAVVSVAMCILCLCGGMLWRANQYDRLASRHADQQREVFHRAFPNDPAPIDVVSRLTAEQRRLHGASGDASGPAIPQNGLITLRDLITHLPAADQLRYRVLELRLDQDQFTLEGQTAAHGDADLIATALRKGGAFNVDPPKTEQLGDPADGTTDKGVSFTVTGSVPTESTDLKRPPQ